VITIFYHWRVGKTTTEAALEFHSVAIESASSSVKVEGFRDPQWVEQTTGR